jgi:hypothetical protein
MTTSVASSPIFLQEGVGPLVQQACDVALFGIAAVGGLRLSMTAARRASVFSISDHHWEDMGLSVDGLGVFQDRLDGLPEFRGLLQRLAVHPGEHQHVARGGFLRNDRAPGPARPISLRRASSWGNCQ